ncbi:MAG TPA: hypothetical protein VJT49_24380 [Amycolatopsis sp.]|uniref:hypothetical protein n=1 Tax=Amycolatopsis sp. TaxID=37632 RepID=UPI002B49E698|nr:hypothetical protein [Amycolatopsis sp.]HKS48189.1 hypothetical protein [Amycolatopsis sp.]
MLLETEPGKGNMLVKCVSQIVEQCRLTTPTRTFDNQNGVTRTTRRPALPPTLHQPSHELPCRLASENLACLVHAVVVVELSPIVAICGN